MRLRLSILYGMLILVGLAAAPRVRAQYELGLETLSDSFIHSLRHLRIALVTNQTGKDSYGRRTIDVLCSRGLKIARILVPEHGLDGRVPAGMDVADSRDAKTGISVMSLYSHGAGKKIDQKILDATDLFMIDLQDCGMRHYTYISTLYTILEASGLHHKRVVVLDRPNPLGDVMEGPLVDPSLHSFISIASIPLRHGMTIGELALYFNNKVIKKQARLVVVPMRDYNRVRGLDGPLLSYLSPNIKSVQACYGYSFLGILGEIKPFQVGIGFGKPFQAIMLPETCTLSKEDWILLAATLRARGINSIFCREYLENPGIWYEGLQIQIPDIAQVQAFNALLAIVDFARKAGVTLTMSPLGDKAIGTKKFRNYLEGTIRREQLVRNINIGLSEFYKKAQSSFLYKPWPHVITNI